MPEVPVELDVFYLPHAHVKQLKKEIECELLVTDFHNTSSFNHLLHCLDCQFRQLQTHEEIEDHHILAQLLSRLPSSSNAKLQNDLHSDNRLSELVGLVHDGLEAVMSDRERVEFGDRLKTAVSSFTAALIPHMDEEEKVFLPLLLEYFSEAELRQLRQRVIDLHQLENPNPGLLSLPPELLVQILSYLPARELLALAPLHSRLEQAVFDGSLWHNIMPVSWAHQCSTQQVPPTDLCCDITRQLVMAGGSVNALLPPLGDDDWSVAVEREASVLGGALEHLLPKVGSHVRTLDLAGGKAVSNEIVFRMLRQCPNLCHLDLSHTGVSDFAFRGLLGRGASMCQLAHVDLTGCSLITDTALQRISQAITTPPPSSGDPGEKSCDTWRGVEPKLKTLVLSGCHLITDVGLSSLAVGLGLPNLTLLDLSGLPNISQTALKSLVEACPLLPPEGLSYCDNIPSGPYYDCANGCQNVDSGERLCCRRLL